MKVDSRALFTYAFVASVLILMLIMLAITPMPAWMEDPDTKHLNGDHNPLAEHARMHAARSARNIKLAFRNSLAGRSSEHPAKHQARTRIAHKDNLGDIMTARQRHGPWFQKGDRVIKTGA
mmetsp:Transcript_22609/g.35366  ORF Transcript_22609/g.35366 Transcript_22609/m.35366 type:complete len:121 (+) Transcript_22609:266-628(+)